MRPTTKLAAHCVRGAVLAAVLAGLCLADTAPASPDAQKLAQLLQRTSQPDGTIPRSVFRCEVHRTRPAREVGQG